MKLFPAIVDALHLLGGYVLLALLTVQAHLIGPRVPMREVFDPVCAPWLRWRWHCSWCKPCPVRG